MGEEVIVDDGACYVRELLAGLTSEGLQKEVLILNVDRQGVGNF